MQNQFEHDVKRFEERSKGLRQSFDKIISQYKIAQISGHETELCIFQNNNDIDVNLRGLFLSKDCQTHIKQPPVQAVLAFELFDSPRISNSMPSEYYMPMPNRSAPARRDRIALMDRHYGAYIEKVK